MTFDATRTPVVYEGGIPVFIDTDEDSWNMSHLAIGCFVSSGAVVNYASMCCDGVHVEANYTIAASTLVPAGTRVKCGEVFDRKTMDINDFFFTPEEWTKRMNELKKSIEMRTPVPIGGQLYNFDDVM